MTTAFQTVIDRATTLSFNKRRKVQQTQSRSGVVKTTSAGGQVWEFQVRLPDGPRYTDYRQLIEAMEALDTVTVGQIQINNSGHSYISGYQGDLGTTSGISVSYTSGNTLTITAGATGLSSGNKFEAGDYIQLGSTGSVYTVTSDVAYNSNTITTHRPILETAGTYSLIVGPSVTWDVVCVQFPNYTLFGHDQIRWSGPFIFVEAI
tara:strand:- start:10150 stop:10767 length:618 start_codon:yes stop_codon:yes gene_type:complete